MMSSTCPSGSITHVIQPGDTFYKLAHSFNMSAEEISAANPGVDAHRLEVGQTICIPQSANLFYEPGGNPAAIANIAGGPLGPQIRGTVSFFDVPNGTWVSVEVNGLPPYRPATNTEDPVGPHGFHIHEFGDCQVGDPENPFLAAGEHWNPTNQPHGNHAGDFPVLFSNQGYATMSFFTDAFKPDQAVGRSVIIHLNPDDYRTQPAGDSGKRLACGVIRQ